MRQDSEDGLVTILPGLRELCLKTGHRNLEKCAHRPLERPSPPEGPVGSAWHVPASSRRSTTHLLSIQGSSCSLVRKRSDYAAGGKIMARGRWASVYTPGYKTLTWRTTYVRIHWHTKNGGKTITDSDRILSLSDRLESNRKSSRRVLYRKVIESQHSQCKKPLESKTFVNNLNLVNLFFCFRQPQRLIDAGHKMRQATTLLDNSTSFKHAEDIGVR